MATGDGTKFEIFIVIVVIINIFMKGEVERGETASFRLLVGAPCSGKHLVSHSPVAAAPPYIAYQSSSFHNDSSGSF